MSQLPLMMLALGTAQQQSTNTALLAWALVLIGVALILFFVEFVVPSGGIIGLVSALCLVGGIIMLFGVNTTLGLFAATVSLIAIPFLFAFALKILPNTPVWRWLMLGDADDPQDDNLQKASGTNDAIVDTGSKGKALTELRPVGTCLINGQRQECLATGGLIHAGAAVEVVAADGMQIKVRKLSG